MKIYKYILNTPKAFDVEGFIMPSDAEILHIGCDPNSKEPAIWIKFDPDNLKQVVREFCVVGTGWEFPNEGKYIGTAICDIFVWHVFDLGEKK